MKIDRLMAITIYLLNHGRTSAQKLAEEFEVSARTIMRDMDTLCQAGIPIQSTFGVDGGFQILDSYVMEKQMANRQDYSFIAAALKGLASAYTNKDIQKTLEKVTAISGQAESYFDVDLSVAHEKEEINERIALLEEAVTKKKVVQFWYTNQSNERKQVQVESVGVIYKWYNWYLIGYSAKYEANRMYKLVRMENLEITTQRNTRKHSLQEALEEKEETQPVITIKLLGKQVIKAKCKEYLNGKITKEYENGDFEYTFTVPETESFWYGMLLSFGGNVKVLEPQSVIKRIQSTCQNILDIYEE